MPSALENLMKEIETAKKFFKARYFTEEEWHATTNIPLKIALDYRIITEVIQTQRVYWTTQEIVNKLNSLSGQDCYFLNYNYKIDDHGNIYEDVTTFLYKMA